jgi:creatine kinase
MFASRFSRIAAVGAAGASALGMGAVALSGGSSAAVDFSKSQFGGVSKGDDKDTDSFKYFTYESQPDFTDKHRSLMAKVLKENPGLFDKLKDKKTSLGYTLSNAIQAGVETPHLGVGITAGDEESWTLFKDIMYPIIQGWHKYDPESGFHPMDLDFSKLQFSSEQAAKFDQYVVSTRIRAARNISGHRLPAGATDEDRLEVEALLKKAFSGFEGELAGKYYSLGGMTSEQEDFLQSNGFLFQKPKTTNLLSWAGAARNWPSGRGIFHNNEKTALCWCNEEDHCRIISMAMGGDVKSVFRRFAQISENLKKSTEADGVGLMFSPRLGFLGTCPSNLGTGLRASVMIKLPELNKDVELLEKVCDAFDLQPRGSAGEHSAAVGAKWDISNKQRLGFSEVQLVQKMIDGVSKIIALEEKLAAGGTITDADLSGSAAGGVDTAALEAKISALEAKVDGIQGAVFGIADILGVKRG